jgi:5'-3' exonuclease
MKTLLIDGQWNLKRNFLPPHRKNLKGANGKLCGGTFGFLDSTKAVLNKMIPDRVVVAWDGFHAGKMRYNIYKGYKSKREKDWESETRIIATEGIGSPEDAEKFQLLVQKIEIQTYLDELFVRQMEADYVEADDLIAYYILGSTDPNEHIYIFSRDQDFYQLISDRVSIISPDSFEIITIHNFKEKMGFCVENALLVKCIEGDDSDEIAGIGGVKRTTLLEYFPAMADEKYTYKRLVEEACSIQDARENGKPKKKRLAKLDTIIESESVVYKNATLMNLKKPFLNQEAIDLVDAVRAQCLDSDRSIESAMQMFAKDGFNKFVGENNLGYFFGPFYNLKSKEKEFEASLK